MEPELTQRDEITVNEFDCSMILTKHPDQPGVKTGLKFFGYWDAITVGLDPIKTLADFDRYARLFEWMPCPNDYVDLEWDAAERKTVIAHLQCWGLENLRPLSAKQNFLDGVRRTRHPKKDD